MLWPIGENIKHDSKHRLVKRCKLNEMGLGLGLPNFSIAKFAGLSRQVSASVASQHLDIRHFTNRVQNKCSSDSM